MGELLTIGQFSRMCWLSIKALRLYDESGLLHPAYVDPATNYRYYTTSQASTARAIAILRSLDIPLADIRDLVNETDPEQFRARLDTHRMVLEERIDRHRRMLARVDDFIRKGAVVTYDITIKDIEPVDVIGVQLTTPPESLTANCSAAYHQLYDALASARIQPVAPPRLVYYDLRDDAWTVEACVPVPDGSAVPQGMTLRRMEGGRAATTLHVGPYDELGIAYREVEMWIKREGLTCAAGPPFDVYVNDPAEAKDPAKFETEIVWPVK